MMLLIVAASRPFRSWKSAALCALAIALACDDGSYYLFNGSEYDPTNDCLDPPAALDVFEGNDPGATCTRICVTKPITVIDANGDPQDGGIEVFVSTECGPTPPGADTSSTNPLCAPALAAFDRDASCLDGGGSSNPLDANVNEPDAQNDVNTD